MPNGKQGKYSIHLPEDIYAISHDFIDAIGHRVVAGWRRQRESSQGMR